MSSSGRGRRTSGDLPSTSLDSAAAVLAAREVRARRRARQRLVAGGRESVAILTDALRDHRQVVRWEATKALGELEIPEAAPALVRAVEDEDAGIRWLAAEGLIALRRKAVVPLLQALISQSDSEWLREGAHHVLRALMRENWAKPMLAVVRALEGPGANVAAPVAADAVLRRIAESA